MSIKTNAPTIEALINEMGRAATNASRVLATASTDQKTTALENAAYNIARATKNILKANEQDVADALKKGLAPAFIDRLTLTDDRLESIVTALREIAAQPDPVGEVTESWSRPNGLMIERVRAPIGVIGVIYESRPNVTIDAAAICLKAGSAVILRGGGDCLATAMALFKPFIQGVVDAGLPASVAQLVETPDRAAVGAMLAGAGGALDLVIPRGGKSLVARVQDEARVAVLSHLDGVCHVYLDKAADLEKAIAITVNAKMRRTGVCGAAETLLIDKAAAPTLLAPVTTALKEAGCLIRADEDARAIGPSLAQASDEDWSTEYLDAVISLALVDGVEGAVDHIRAYGSGHTDAIVTEDAAAAHHFLHHVDSAIVMHNASTQFADGGEFGLGAEIGIATGKLHARGPVGARELTTYRNIVRGQGQIRPR